MSSIYFLTVILGFFSGFLSGVFGVGGGILTTPGLRIILGQSAGIAIGTPLPVMIPSAIVGAYNYNREKYVDWPIAKNLSVFGLPGVLIGSLFTGIIDPKIVMVITAILIAVLSLGFLRQGKEDKPFIVKKYLKERAGTVGFSCGLFSGFLGLGGGILLVPALKNIFDRDIKTAFGTSLAVIIVFTLPGTVAHMLLGHVNIILSVLLAAGVIPGAYFGSKTAFKISGDYLRIAFGVFLLMIALYFLIFEFMNFN